MMPIPEHPAQTKEEQIEVPAADAGRHSDTDTQKSVADVIGIFADEPLWDEVMAKVKAFRKQQDAAS